MYRSISVYVNLPFKKKPLVCYVQISIYVSLHSPGGV